MPRSPRPSRPSITNVVVVVVVAVVTVASALSSCVAPIAASARDVLTFNFGWKHRTGLRSKDDPDSEPPSDTDPGPHPPESRIDYSDDDDDRHGWIDVRLPHDGLIASSPSRRACPDGCSGKSYLPRHVLWYRKSFELPAEWEGSAVWISFGGSFRNTTVWINGGDPIVNHACGYTPFRVRLDDMPSVRFGRGEENVVAVFVDPDNGDGGGRERGSGWWYEGGGLYRNVHLIRAHMVHVEPDGMFAYSDVVLRRDILDADDSDDDGGIAPTAVSATLHVRASVVKFRHTRRQEGLSSAPRYGGICASFKVTSPEGTIEAASKPKEVNFDDNGHALVRDAITVPSPRLWTMSDPALYQVTADLRTCNGRGGSGGDDDDDDDDTLDSVSVAHGFRTIQHTPDGGLYLNGRHFKVRGFCDHDTFAVVGMAVPDRIKLFRAQASRAVGGNGRRTSHNPPSPSMLDIYDRLGMVVMDENRLFGENTAYVQNFAALVKRDRNHPSVIIWSFCNEVGCEGAHEQGGPAFQATATELDGSRPTLANMFTYDDLLSDTVDVQGFSHRPRETLDQCHADMPYKPIYQSECCSCNTMRDEDVGCETQSDNPHTLCTQMSFNARCLESNHAVNASDGVSYAAGTMVWTLFDYYGEPPVGGPEVSGTYGQFDLCGFPKASAFWFRTQWLLGIPDASPDKTFPTHGKHEVRIVESWESPNSWNETKDDANRTIHAYSNAPYVELFVNDKSYGTRHVVPMRLGPGSYAEWTAVPWEAGTITAVARESTASGDHDGGGGKNEAASSAIAHRHTNGRPTTLVLSVDSPSPETGTGSALLLDGQDAALVRCTIVDESGTTVHLSTHNVTFRIVSGPGFVQGTHNGDSHCQEPNDAPWHSAYHGLVRAVIRVSSIAAVPAWERKMLGKIDRRGPMADAAAAAAAAAAAVAVAVAVRPGVGGGGETYANVYGETVMEGYGRSRRNLRMGRGVPSMSMDDGDIIVEATSPGFEPVTLTIHTSTDPSAASVISVARASAGREVVFFAPSAPYQGRISGVFKGEMKRGM